MTGWLRSFLFCRKTRQGNSESSPSHDRSCYIVQSGRFSYFSSRCRHRFMATYVRFTFLGRYSSFFFFFCVRDWKESLIVMFFFSLCEPIGPVGYHHYRALMVGSVGMEGNESGPSPIRGPGWIFIVVPYMQVHATLQILQCTLYAPGGVVVTCG